MARDQANPEKTATSRVYIRVKRDLRMPVFEGEQCNKIISEKMEVGATVCQMRGRDDDKMVRIQTFYFCGIYVRGTF